MFTINEDCYGNVCSGGFYFILFINRKILATGIINKVLLYTLKMTEVQLSSSWTTPWVNMESVKNGECAKIKKFGGKGKNLNHFKLVSDC